MFRFCHISLRSHHTNMFCLQLKKLRVSLSVQSFLLILALVFLLPIWAETSALAKSPEKANTPATETAELAEPGEITEEAATPEEDSAAENASGGVTLIDITQIKTEPFTLKKEGFEKAGQTLGKQVDEFEAGLASGSADWLRNPAFLGISRLKLLLSILLLCLLGMLDLILRWLIGRKVARYQLNQPTLADLAKHASNRIDMIIEALRPPLSLFIWGYGGLTVVAFLFSQISHEDELIWIPVSAGKIAELGGLIAFFWLILRLTTVLDTRLALWAEQTPSHWDNILVPFVAKTLRLVLIFITIIFSLPFFSLSTILTTFTQRLVTLSLIGAITWILFQLVQVVEQGIMEPYGKDFETNLEARKVYTQVHILKKVVLTIIGGIALSVVLMVFESVRQIGTSILASAGVLGIIVGLAAQKSISTLLAGIQIAITQPMRIGDVVIVENEWGWIEEITLTYVVVRIWDLRRLVLPIGYFLEKPFQNWTRTSAQILGTVYLYVDYRFPVDLLREPLRKLAEASPNWDHKVCGLVVTGTSDRCVEIRALVSAADSGKAWDLRCEIREGLLRFLQEQHPEALPQVRLAMNPDNQLEPTARYNQLPDQIMPKENPE